MTAIEHFTKHFQEQGYFNHHRRVLVAVSGGQDSMSLLDILYVSRETLGLDLAIAHVNHHQRPQSDQEEAYLRAWATEHDLPIYVAHFTGTFTERAARDCRYDFFAKVMAEQGYTALVTAHHRDDQVETVLMRLLRGSRLRHLTGIRPVRPFAGGELIRPLLLFSKGDLPQVFHFEDESNQELTYTRNKIRHQILPDLRPMNPALDQHLVNLADEVAVWQEAIRELTADLVVTNLLQFRQQTQAVQSLLLQDYLADFSDLQLSKAQFDQVLHILQVKSNYQAPLKSGYELLIGYQDWQIRKISPETHGQNQPQVLHYGQEVEFSNYILKFSESQPSTAAVPSQEDEPAATGDQASQANKRSRQVDTPLLAWSRDKREEEAGERADLGEARQLSLSTSFDRALTSLTNSVNQNAPLLTIERTGIRSQYKLQSSAPLMVRRTRAGDRIRLGDFHKKLARLFIDQKLKKEERQAAVVVEQAGKILLVLTDRRTYLRKAENRDIMELTLQNKRKR